MLSLLSIFSACQTCFSLKFCYTMSHCRDVGYSKCFFDNLRQQDSSDHDTRLGKEGSAKIFSAK